MSDRPGPDLSALAMIRTLHRNQVNYIIIGGFAAVTLGSPLVTWDLDICPGRSAENLSRLAKSLNQIAAVEWDPRRDQVSKRKWTTEFLGTDDTWLLVTSHGPLDVLLRPRGVDGYRELVRHASDIKLGRLTVKVASLTDLIRMKRASGRPEDLAAVKILKRLQMR